MLFFMFCFRHGVSLLLIAILPISVLVEVMESSTHVANELAKDQDGVSQVQRPLSSERAERDFVVEVNKEHEPRDPSLTALPDDSRNLVGSNAMISGPNR